MKFLSSLRRGILRESIASYPMGSGFHREKTASMATKNRHGPLPRLEYRSALPSLAATDDAVVQSGDFSHDAAAKDQHADHENNSQDHGNERTHLVGELVFERDNRKRADD